MVAHTRNPDSSNLPGIKVFNLRHGNAEFVLQSGYYRLDNPPLVLERLAFREMYINSAGADIHRASDSLIILMVITSQGKSPEYLWAVSSVTLTWRSRRCSTPACPV
jgi:hypothetical protein